MITTGWWIVNNSVIKLKFVLLSVPPPLQYDYIGLPIGETSDLEEFQKRLQFDLIPV